jgi:hypothetical protein
VSETLTIFFVFFGVIAVTAVVFAVWLVLALLRLVFRGLFGICGISPRPRAVLGPTCTCPGPGCHATNPSTARFCRRCGRELLKSNLLRHAALW